MSNWDILGDDSMNTNSDEDVEYVGMVDDDTPQVKVPRRPVRRTSQATIPSYRPSAKPMRPMKPMTPMTPKSDSDAMVYMPTASGAQVAMNTEAVQNLNTSSIYDVGGRAGRRIQPGMYVTYGPGHGPSGHLSDGMGGGLGTNGLYDEIIGGSAVNPQYDYDFGNDPAANQQRGGGFDIGGLIGGIGSGIGDVIGSITGSVVNVREQRAQAELLREQMQIEQEAATAARQIGEREAAREHELAMERIRQRQAELEELQRTGAALDEQRGAYPATPPPSDGGVSPVVWVLLAVVGVGGLGGVVWLLTRNKKED